MTESLDIAVVGAGPCGIAVGAAAKKKGLSVALYDKGCIASSLVKYPYYMTFFSTAEKLEIADVPFTIAGHKPTRQEALVYYRRVVQSYDIKVHQYHEVLSLEGSADDFTLASLNKYHQPEEIRAKYVVLATGGFNQPNFLRVPGEDLSKVSHYYQEAHPYYDQEVMVVGAGNSAVECALELYRTGAKVSMVHFGLTIDKGVKPWVIPDITNRIKKKEIQVYWEHRIDKIYPDSVILSDINSDDKKKVSNDWVLAMTGWSPDKTLLDTFHIKTDAKTGIPYHNPDTMESDHKGIYIAGVLAAGKNANKIFIENGKLHGSKVVQSVADYLTI